MMISWTNFISFNNTKLFLHMYPMKLQQVESCRFIIGLNRSVGPLSIRKLRFWLITKQNTIEPPEYHPFCNFGHPNQF